MSDGVKDGSLPLFLKESVEESDVRHAALCGKRSHLIIGEVSWNIAQGLGVAVAANYRLAAYVQGIVEALLATMAQVDHYAVTVHLLDDFLAELANPVVGITSPCGFADVVIPVMAQRYVDYTTLCEVLHVAQIAVQGQSVLYAEHYALASFPLVLIEVGRRSRDADILGVVAHDALQLIEYQVGIVVRGYRSLGNAALRSLHGLCLDVFLRQVGIELRYALQVDGL